MNKKIYVPLIVGAFLLLMVVIGATYAYFLVGTSYGEYTTNITLETESLSAVSLKAGTSLNLKLSAVDMMRQDEDVVYYATEDGTPQTEENVLPLATILSVDDNTYSCNYTLNIAYSGDMKEAITGEGTAILNIAGVDYDVYSTEFPKTISGTLNGLSSSNPQSINGSLRIINLEGTDQSAMAGTKMTFTFTATEFDCSKEYNITYNLEGGTFNDEQPTKYNEKTETFTLGIPSKENYTFLGWTGSNGTTPQEFLTIAKGSTGDRIYTANWKAEEVIVTLNANEGSISSVMTYTSATQHVYNVPEDGTYSLEVWGAEGGTSQGYAGGKGGYSYGDINLSKGTTLYINVGGKGGNGAKNTTIKGGYNGGGSGISNDGASYGCGGGGASHIATKSGILSSLNTYESDCNSYLTSCPVLIVAGGGGGANYFTYLNTIYGYGGSGGGASGTSGSYNSSYTNTGATQTTGAGFGKGGNGALVTDGSFSGGGGGYYGAKAPSNRGGAGGGAGYIGHPSLTNKYMYCYNCSTSPDANTLTYSTKNASSVLTKDYAKTGDGAARITQLTTTRKISYGLNYTNLPTPVREGYEFLGWNTKADGSGTYISSGTTVSTNKAHTLYAIWAIGAKYIYSKGNVYTNTTGGWVGYNAGCDGQGICSCKPTINNSYNLNGTNVLRLYAYNINNFGKAIARTVEKVDLTNYSKLVFVMAKTQCGSGESAQNWSTDFNYAYVGATSGNSLSNFVAKKASTSAGTITIDISSVSGSYYIGAHLMSSGSDIFLNISDIYLLP